MSDEELVADLIEQLQETIDIINFWNNPPEISRLRGTLSDLVLMTGIDEMIDNSDNLVTEIMALAKKTSAGHRRVMRKYKDIQYTLKRSKRKWIYTNQRTSFIPTIPKRSGTRWTK